MVGVKVSRFLGLGGRGPMVVEGDDSLMGVKIDRIVEQIAIVAPIGDSQ